MAPRRARAGRSCAVARWLGPVCALAAILGAGASVSAAQADGLRIDGAHARVEITDASDDAVVTLSWRIALPPGATAVPVRAIPFFGLRPSAVRTPNGAAFELHADTPGGALEGAASLSPGSSMLVLSYTVPDAIARSGDRLDLRVPLLLPDGVPAGSPDDFFTAELIAPPGLTVTGGFPTVPFVRDTLDAGARYTLRLQVVPSLLRWQATRGDPPLLSFERLVDLLLLVVLTGLGLAGLRVLRRTA